MDSPKENRDFSDECARNSFFGIRHTIVACWFPDSVVDGTALDHGNYRGRFRLCLVLFASAANACQFLLDHFGGHTRLVADLTWPAVYCVFQAFVCDISAVATLSPVLFIFFP